MSNYWAIAIGINQYQNFKPLLYAQWDAQALWNYWVKEGGIPQNQCILLSDGMVADSDLPLVPTQQVIKQHLNALRHRIEADDVVWCFFSGYGIQLQDIDYLMPLEGDPQQVAQTGIAAGEFFDLLNNLPSDNVVVVLDLKRPPDTPPSARLGDDILRQAQAFNRATLLASQPDQASHETLTLRQGIFTYTIIEGLRTQGCFQLGTLAQYVEARLPELSESHWRGRQQASLVIPQNYAQLQLVPATTVSAASDGYSTPRSGIAAPPQPDGSQTTQLPFRPPATNAPPQPHGGTVQLPSLENGAQQMVYAAPSSTPATNYTSGSNASPDFADRNPKSENPTIQPYPNPPSNNNGEDKMSQKSNKSSFWTNFLLIMLGIFGIVVLRNLPSLRGVEPSSPPSEMGEVEEAPTSPNPTSLNADPMVPTGEAGTALERAKAAQSAGLYAEALQWLDQVPATGQTEEYEALRTELEQFRDQAGQRNQAILNEAIASLNQEREFTPVSQASDFGRAIALANRIQPGQPLYDEAQRYVQRWGLIILDLAKARAQSGEYEQAIGAASLIEPDIPGVYQQAQTLIQTWQQYVDTGVSNQEVIDGAIARIEFGNTLSHSRAIREVLTI
ncbi:MAG: caspase family protein, partial [Leptolyngbyaceae cyanobacterium]